MGGCCRRIPGQPAPASLKPNNRRWMPRRCRWNSGAACPGLIEAGGQELVHQPVPRRNSGAACPGLIEAIKRLAALCSAWPGIPGQPAPASLKQRGRPRHVQFRDRNSGAACPGLIEARAASNLPFHCRMNSGAACPGLIEAALCAISTFIASANSGAACPGLIEAGHVRISGGKSRGEFRGSLPRPH